MTNITRTPAKNKANNVPQNNKRTYCYSITMYYKRVDQSQDPPIKMLTYKSNVTKTATNVLSFVKQLKTGTSHNKKPIQNVFILN